MFFVGSVLTVAARASRRRTHTPRCRNTERGSAGLRRDAGGSRPACVLTPHLRADAPRLGRTCADGGSLSRGSAACGFVARGCSSHERTNVKLPFHLCAGQKPAPSPRTELLPGTRESRRLNFVDPRRRPGSRGTRGPASASAGAFDPRVSIS